MKAAAVADLILRNGRIYTVDAARSWASAVAVRNGRYIAIGDDAAVAPYRDETTRVVDLGGRMAMPGITDIHTHMLMGGQAEMFDLNFSSALGLEDICSAVAAWVGTHPGEGWIVGAQFGTDKLPALNTAAALAKLDAVSQGRRVLLRVEKDAARPGRTMLSCRGLTVRDGHGTPRVDDVSLEVRAGEIVGIAGISGNGQSELLEALAGMRPVASGTIAFDGQPVPEAMRDPHDLRQRGLLHVPEDRLRMGLVPTFAAMESAILGFHDEPRYGGGILLNVRAIEQDTAGKMEAYDVRPRAPRLKTAKFSGGNQQKLVLAREIERAPKVLLVGQPTRGVDIGAIEFIHRRLVALRDQGVAILLVSVELEEIMGLADRIIVMCGGRITGERDAARTDERDLGLLMAGVTESAA